MPTPPSLEEVIRKALAPQYGARGSEALMTRWWNSMRKRPRHRMRAGDRQYWRAQALLSEATFYVDAARSERTGTGLKNLGTGGSALNAKFGSANPSAYFNGTALVLPGSSSNYANTPSAAALDITGDIEIVVRVAADDWTPATTQIIMSKRSVTNLSWQLALDTTGAVHWSFNNGADLFNNGFLAAPSALTDGTAYWLKFTRVASTGVIALQQAPDQVTEPTTWPTTWTPSGTRSTGNIAAKAVELAIGASRGGTVGDNFAGKVYRAIVRNGIAGTTVFDADFAKPFDTTSFTATTGQTVTLTRSTSGSDTNDPTLLPHTGTNYLYLPGVAGNYVSVPDEAALDITGDIEIVVRAALDDWTPAAQSALVSKLGGAGVRAYSFVLSPSGQLKFDWSTDGTTIPTASSTIALPAVDGTAYWVKMTRSTSGSVNFYYAADQATEPTSWTQLGTTVAGTAGAIFVNTNTLDVGGRGTVDPAAGKFYRAIVRNGIGGTTVFDADFTTGITSGGQTSFTASTGQTVTINRATSGRKAVAVTRPIVLLGADDYFEVADNALLNFGATDSFTVVAVVRPWNTTVASRLVGKRANAGTGPRWGLEFAATTPTLLGLLNDGTTAGNGGGAATLTIGGLSVASMVVNRTAQTNTTYINTTAGASPGSTTLVGSLSNALPMRIGSMSDAVTPTDAELVAAAVFRRALSATEIADIVNYYNTVT